MTDDDRQMFKEFIEQLVNALNKQSGSRKDQEQPAPAIRLISVRRVNKSKYTAR